MSKAFQCDRCGKLNEGRPKRVLKGDLVLGYVDEADVSICEECWKSLAKVILPWWSEGRKKRYPDDEYSGSSDDSGGSILSKGGGSIGSALNRTGGRPHRGGLRGSARHR